MTADVWYCQNRRCRWAVRCEPPGAVACKCRCKTPIVPLHPCRVIWDERPSSTPTPPRLSIVQSDQENS